VTTLAGTAGSWPWTQAVTAEPPPETRRLRLVQFTARPPSTWRGVAAEQATTSILQKQGQGSMALFREADISMHYAAPT
jgi:hypothetical protein